MIHVKSRQSPISDGRAGAAEATENWVGKTFETLAPPTSAFNLQRLSNFSSLIIYSYTILSMLRNSSFLKFQVLLSTLPMFHKNLGGQMPTLPTEFHGPCFLIGVLDGIK